MFFKIVWAAIGLYENKKKIFFQKEVWFSKLFKNLSCAASFILKVTYLEIGTAEVLTVMKVQRVVIEIKKNNILSSWDPKQIFL